MRHHSMCKCIFILHTKENAWDHQLMDEGFGPNSKKQVIIGNQVLHCIG